jgi:hypothetical protein
MRRAMTGWIVVAVGFVGLGLGAVVGAQRAQVRELPAGTIQAWRQYAGEVERGTRMPSGVTSRLLTEAAIAQHAREVRGRSAALRGRRRRSPRDLPGCRSDPLPRETHVRIECARALSQP